MICRLVVVGLLMALVPAKCLAQSETYHGTVTETQVTLYAGPSDRFPATTELKKGDTVIVFAEENGWLAVQDPPSIVRSISWVRTQVVNFNKDKPIPQLVVVDETGATLRAGQMGVAQPTSIQKAKVPAGTILTVIGPGVKFDDGTWYPVVPPAGDWRYVPKTAIRFEKPANTTIAVRDTTPSVRPAGGSLPAASIPGAGSGSAGKPVGVNHPLWGQAESAEREGRFEEAERLYFSLARVMNEPGGNHDVANLCYTRIHSLREKRRGLAGGTTSTNRPTSNDPGRTTGAHSIPSGTDPRGDQARRSGSGRLVRSRIDLDGRTTYRLEDANGEAAMYVVPGPNVELERYLGKQVDVTGVVHSRQGLSKPYMVATRIEQAP